MVNRANLWCFYRTFHDPVVKTIQVINSEAVNRIESLYLFIYFLLLFIYLFIFNRAYASKPCITICIITWETQRSCALQKRTLYYISIHTPSPSHNSVKSEHINKIQIQCDLRCPGYHFRCPSSINLLWGLFKWIQNVSESHHSLFYVFFSIKLIQWQLYAHSWVHWKLERLTTNLAYF